MPFGFAFGLDRAGGASRSLPLVVSRSLASLVSRSRPVNHLLYIPHTALGATWDLQLLVADPGGLDLAEERIEIACNATGLRGRVYADSGVHSQFYDGTVGNSSHLASEAG